MEEQTEQTWRYLRPLKPKLPMLKPNVDLPAGCGVDGFKYLGFARAGAEGEGVVSAAGVPGEMRVLASPRVSSVGFDATVFSVIAED